jgi:hypothetical protein
VVVLGGLGVGLLVAPAMSTATRGPHPSVASAFVSTSQQIGGSLGTALLNTIAASSTTAYLAAHASMQHAAAIHGDGTACLCGAAVLAVAAAGCAALLRTVPAPGVASGATKTRHKTGATQPATRR